MQMPRLQPGKGPPAKLPALVLPPRESSPIPRGDSGGSRGRASPGHLNSIADARQSQEGGSLEVGSPSECQCCRRQGEHVQQLQERAPVQPCPCVGMLCG